jgi:hypothetical protein
MARDRFLQRHQEIIAALERTRFVKRAVKTIWAVAVAASVAWVVPSRLCAFARGADPMPLERGLAEIIDQPLTRGDFPTGSKLLDGEWLFATYMMAGMGFGQVALEHPELLARELPLIKKCIAKLISKPVRQFDTDAWSGHDALSQLDDDARAHASYLGYLNLLLSLDHRLDPQSQYAPLNDRITAALARRLKAEPLLPSYPGEYFPVDNAAVIGSIALHDRAVGSSENAAVVARFCRRLDEKWRDQATGLLHQTEPHGAPRGSGTALASYFLSFADRRLSSELLAATKKSLYGDVLGFGAIREYPRGRAGKGDADSGPIVAGFGVSATGFAVGAARAHNDQALFERLWPTVELFGAPVEKGGVRRYTSGGSVGNAILFAMLTAPRRQP